MAGLTSRVAVLALALPIFGIFNPYPGNAGDVDQVYFQNDGWTVAAMRKQGVFLGCYAAKDYQSGTRWVFARYRNDKWMALVGEHAGRPDTVGRAELFVDGVAIHSALVPPNSAHLGRLGQLSDEAIKVLADGHVLELANSDGRYRFNLSGSEDALNKALECVDTFESEERGPGDVPQANQPSTVRPQPRQRVEAEYLPPAESVLMLTSILNAAKMSGYQIDTPTTSSSGIKFRTAGGAIGFFLAARGRDTKNADEYSSGVIAQWASVCDGEFRSGKQPVAVTNGSIVRRVITSCKMSDRDFTTDTTVIRRPDGFLIELAQSYRADALRGTETAPQSKSALVDAALRLP